jgi:bifunctional non-homologous end joining protein LigD
LKFKFVESASFVITGINTKRSVTLGLYDGDRLVPAGNVTIPPNHEIPQIGTVCDARYYPESRIMPSQSMSHCY